MAQAGNTLRTGSLLVRGEQVIGPYAPSSPSTSRPPERTQASSATVSRGGTGPFCASGARFVSSADAGNGRRRGLTRRSTASGGSAAPASRRERIVTAREPPGSKARSRR